MLSVCNNRTTSVLHFENLNVLKARLKTVKSIYKVANIYISTPVIPRVTESNNYKQLQNYHYRIKVLHH